MNRSRILLIAGFLFAVYSCTKEGAIHFSNPNVNPNPDTVYGTPPPAASNTPYDLTETFDYNYALKNGYASDTTTLSSGVWTLADALLTTQDTTRIGTWCVRIQTTGSVTTNFSINGLKMVYVSSSVYNKDGAASYQLQASTDGNTFSPVGAPTSVSSTTMHIDSFVINTTAPVRIRIAKISGGGKRIDIDNIEFKGIGNPGFKVDTSINGTPPSYDGDTTPRLVVVTASDVVQPLAGDNSNMLLGNPSGADSTSTNKDNHLFNQHYYIESYSETQGKPNWTAWHLGNDDIGSSGRGDDFAAWAGLPAGWYLVRASDYSNSGYERGHNCPSADRTSTVNANDATFLMTNMMPQTAANNEHTWGNLENDTRSLVQNGNEAYIYCGSYGNAGTIDNGHVTVPTNTWKIVVILPKGDNDISRITAATRVIAVNIPNTNSVNADWKQYIVTVDDIEKATGYSFFSTITDSAVRDALKSKKDSGN